MTLSFLKFTQNIEKNGLKKFQIPPPKPPPPQKLVKGDDDHT